MGEIVKRVSLDSGKAASWESLDVHVARADVWAKERLRSHPELSSVSVQLGVMFGVMSGVTLTWNRVQQHVES